MRDFPVPPSPPINWQSWGVPYSSQRTAIQLATYQPKGNALPWVECERLGQLPPRLGERRGCAELDARRWSCALGESLRIRNRYLDVFLSKPFSTLYTAAL